MGSAAVLLPTAWLLNRKSNNLTFKSILVKWFFLFQGACEGNIRAPQTNLANHVTNDVDNRQQYQRYFSVFDFESRHNKTYSKYLHHWFTSKFKTQTKSENFSIFSFFFFFIFLLIHLILSSG